MSGILCHILGCMLFDSRSEATCSLFRQGLRRFKYKLDVQCIRELDGHRIPQEGLGESRHESKQHVWGYDNVE